MSKLSESQNHKKKKIKIKIKNKERKKEPLLKIIDEAVEHDFQLL